jgi:hypothetical protein
MMLATFITVLAGQSPALAQQGAAEKQAAVQKESKPVIQETLSNGRFIRLSDNSLWEINPQDRPVTQSWITPVEIITSPGDNPDYPFVLTNSLTGSKVAARRATGKAVLPAPKTTAPSPKQ